MKKTIPSPAENKKKMSEKREQKFKGFLSKVRNRTNKGGKGTQPRARSPTPPKSEKELPWMKGKAVAKRREGSPPPGERNARGQVRFADQVGSSNHR